MATAVGKPIERVDGRKKVTGAAKYAADFHHDRLAHAVLAQSTIARGRTDSVREAPRAAASDAMAVRVQPGELPAPAADQSHPVRVPGGTGDRECPPPR